MTSDGTHIVEPDGICWKNLIREAAILGLSINEVFEMDLWQLFYYMEGYEQRKIETLQMYLNLAQYTNMCFGGKRSDVRGEFDRLDSLKYQIYTKEEDTIESDEQKIQNIKDDFKLFD